MCDFVKKLLESAVLSLIVVCFLIWLHKPVRVSPSVLGRASGLCSDANSEVEGILIEHDITVEQVRRVMVECTNGGLFELEDSE